MFIVFKRKILLYSTCIIVISFLFLLAVLIQTSGRRMSADVAVNSSVYESDIIPGQAVEVISKRDFYSEAKYNRDVARGKTMEMLQNIIDNSSTSQESKTDAEKRLILISSDINKEVTAENILRSKGINNVVVFINENLVNVIVDKISCDNAEIAKINDIIYEITGNNNIKMVEVK